MNKPLFSKCQETIQWYKSRLEDMLKEIDEIKADKAKEEAKDIEEELVVQDHTYDIREIYPYNIFLENEDLMQRENDKSIKDNQSHLSNESEELNRLENQLRKSDVLNKRDTVLPKILPNNDVKMEELNDEEE